MALTAACRFVVAAPCAACAARAAGHAVDRVVLDGDLVVVDALNVENAKTAALRDAFGKLGWAKALIIAGPEVDVNFGLAARSIPNVDVLPVQGINVYDILRRDKLVLTRAGVEALEARLK